MTDYVTSQQFADFLQEEREHHGHQEARVVDVEKQVQEIHKTLGIFQHNLEMQITARLDRHAKTLYGNGEPGMDEQIRHIYDWIKEQKEKEKDKQGEIKKYIFWGITYLVSQGVGILVARLVLP